MPVRLPRNTLNCCPRGVALSPPLGACGGLRVNVANQSEVGIEQGLAPIGCVYDPQRNLTGKVYALMTTPDEAGGVSTFRNVLINLNGTSVDPYNGAFEDCDVDVVPQSPAELVVQCLYDDVNGDGSELVPYIVATAITFGPNGNLISNAVGTFTDRTLSTVYVPVGTPVEPDSVGSDAVTTQHSTIVSNGQAWSPSSLTKQWSARIDAVGAGVNFTDSDGNTRTLVQGEVIGFEIETLQADTSPIIVTTPGAIVVVTYTELGV